MVLFKNPTLTHTIMERLIAPAIMFIAVSLGYISEQVVKFFEFIISLL